MRINDIITVKPGKYDEAFMDISTQFMYEPSEDVIFMDTPAQCKVVETAETWCEKSGELHSQADPNVCVVETLDGKYTFYYTVENGVKDIMDRFEGLSSGKKQVILISIAGLMVWAAATLTKLFGGN